MNKPYVIFKSADTEYKLAINSRAAAELETKLGGSLYSSLARLDEIGVITKILWAATQKYQPDTAIETAYQIYDDYTESGGTLNEFTDVILNVLVTSGFLPKEAVENIAKMNILQDSLKSNQELT